MWSATKSAKKPGAGPPFSKEAPVTQPTYLNVFFVSAKALCTGAQAVSSPQINALFLGISPRSSQKILSVVRRRQQLAHPKT